MPSPPPRLVPSCALIERVIRRWLTTLYLGEEVPSFMMLEEHREIAQAYIRKDLAGLTKSITNHVTKQRDQVLENLESQDLSRVT